MSLLEYLKRGSEHEDVDKSRSADYDIGFFHSAKEVIKSHFGGRWLPVKFLGLLVLVFWPTLAYWRHIEFDRPLFVSEWLKLSLESVTLFLILEILRHRSLSFDVRQSTDRILLTNYVVPARAIITALLEFRKRVGEGEIQDDAAALLRTAWHAWHTLEFALSDVSIQSLPYDYMRTLLLRGRAELKPARCASLLNSIRAMRHSSELIADEYEDLMKLHRAFLATLEDGAGHKLQS